MPRTSEYPPGSHYAIVAGCVCRPDILEPERKWIAAACPLHGETPEAKMFADEFARQMEARYRADEREGMQHGNDNNDA